MRIRRLLRCACLLIGCATVPMALAEQGLSAQQMAPPTGKALVYVYRSAGLQHGVRMFVTLDGYMMGRNPDGTYLMWALNPGEHEITSITRGFGEEIQAKLRLRVEAGKTYFVQQKIGVWRIKLRLVDENKGRQGVSQTSQIYSNLAFAQATPLHDAAWKGNLAKVEKLIAQGANVNARDLRSTTPLHYAARKGHTGVTELLIAKGADIHAKGWDDSTPLHMAAFKGYERIAELLIAKGADVDARAWADLTPLHMAAFNGYERVVELLIAKGADVNARNEDGETPRGTASRYLHRKVAKLLKRHGGKK